MDHIPLEPTFPSLCMTQACLKSSTLMIPSFSPQLVKSWYLANTTHVFTPSTSITFKSRMNVYWSTMRIKEECCLPFHTTQLQDHNSKCYYSWLSPAPSITSSVIKLSQVVPSLASQTHSPSPSSHSEF